MKAIEVVIQPVGPVNLPQLQNIARELEKRLPVKVEVRIAVWPLPLNYSKQFNWKRMQLKAPEVNMAIKGAYEGYIKPGERVVVGVIAGDGYVSGLNFIFGLAIPDLGVATVYTERLSDSDVSRFLLRLLKEVMHELGHLLGLNHCVNPKCVMSFSNSVADVDAKDAWFCPTCRVKLEGLS
ncbi:MAG: archaemetzincin family Zn-dependent metalloprotease [Thermoprotei archaeon]|nr:archaemetzincin family Zn-dependent metalloprotease [Thermoprotei archaeon]